MNHIDDVLYEQLIRESLYSGHTTFTTIVPFIQGRVCKKCFVSEVHIRQLTWKLIDRGEILFSFDRKFMLNENYES